MQIEWLEMTRRHYQPGSPGRVRMVVLHATAGRAPGDLGWLRKGGDERRPVSVHYYIDKTGRIVQLVKEDDIAWHAGKSTWAVDGRVIQNCNTVSIGIELENLNSGRDPYPEAQYAAALALTRDLVRRHNVPCGQLVRHLDIAPGRKTDPAGFPWQRFVSEVYAGLPGASDDPQEQLRALMQDLAYRAAGGALPAAWPLFAAARAAGLGMPVAVISGRPLVPNAPAAQDDRDRAVRLRGQPPLLVEVYARDLLYAPVTGEDDTSPAPATARRLADTPPGALRDALIRLMFRAADPVNGFQPGWAFHQYWLAHTAELGAPIGPNHRIALSGRAYACQHFALDSLCSPVGDWRTIYRLGELSDVTPGLDLPGAIALRSALLDDLYRARTARRYDPAALLTRHAESRRLGAPLAPPEVAMIEGQPYLLTPYALDVLACRLPRLSWPLEQQLPAETTVSALSEALVTLGAPASLGPGALLGAPGAPTLLDLSLYAPARRIRAGPGPDTLLIGDAPGPAAADLRHEADAARWHYYVETGGMIYRLRDERYAAAAAPGADLAERAVVVAVEGGAASAGLMQRAALVWLVRTLSTGLRIAPQRVHAFSPAPMPLDRQEPALIAEGGDNDHG